MKTPRYVVLDKDRGETPLEAIVKWKKSHTQYQDLPASYAGRLDPMATGKLLVLLGDECKRQDQYTKLDKEYDVEIVLDLKTDTGDVLGLAENADKNSNASRAAILKALRHELGTHMRAYPSFSSKTFHGKPLFLYALENKLKEIEIPEHPETFYRIKLLKTKTVSKSELQRCINDALAIVPRSDEPSKELGADFRQDEIRTRWQRLFSDMPERDFRIITIRVICGSGAYMRTLAERIGAWLGTTAFALSIHRTNIGIFVSLGPLSFWSTLLK